MSFMPAAPEALVAAPEALVAAASDLAGIGSSLNAANASASLPTTGLLPAGADGVSTQLATLLSAHGQLYQRLSAQAAAFHEQFVKVMTASANRYATAEANAAQTLLTRVNAPAEAMLGHPLTGGGASTSAGSVTARGAAGGIVSSAVGRVESVLLGNGAAGLIGSGGSGLLRGGSGLLGGAGGTISNAARSALLLAPTGGAGGVTTGGALPRLLSGITNAAVAPAASGSIANAIENAYLVVEPYVQYGFNLLAYAVGFVPWVGFLAPQINFLYNLIEPIVQSALFNTLDWLSGAISFGHGLSNFFAATTSSINVFIQTEINWLLGFLPPLPPLPPFP
jgi:PE family